MQTVAHWLERSRDWLDERGKAAWIIAMVIGFVVFWPIGLALLFYMIWSKRMTCNWRNHGHNRHFDRHGTTGNTAFDSYREETLKRLEEERDAFVRFLDQLRAAKDRAEFDQFISSRQQPPDRRTKAAASTRGAAVEAGASKRVAPCRPRASVRGGRSLF